MTGSPYFSMLERSDNGIEFKNNDLNQLYLMMGIKREFSVPRTSLQNGIAERKNRTLIEAARTMLADSLLPIPFWAEAINTGSGPTWLFDIYTLIKTMNFQPVTAGNQSNPSEPEFIGRNPKSKVNVSSSNSAQTKKHDDKTKREAKDKSHIKSSTGYRNLSVEFEDFSNDNINEVNAVVSLVLAVGQISTNSTNTFSVAGPSNIDVSPTHRKSSYVDTSQLPDDLNITELEDITYSDDVEDVGVEADFTNLETTITVSFIPTTRVHKDHPVTQIISDLYSASQTRSMTRVAKDQGGLSQINNDDFHTLDVKSAFLYETIKEEVYFCQALGFEDPDYLNKVYKVVKALYGLHQARRAWYETLANYLLKQDAIFISQDKYVAEILRKFGLTDGKSANTQIDIKKHLLKDPDSLDRKSTTGGCQFLGCTLISWQCKKQIVVATSSTKAKAQVGDLSSHITKYSSRALTQKQDDDAADEGAASVAIDDVPVAADEPIIPSATPTTPPPPPSQDVPSTLQGRIIASMDVDEDVTLKVVANIAKEVVVDAEIEEKVMEVVNTAKLMTEVVTASSATITVADTLILAAIISAATVIAAPSAARKRKGVVIRDPEEIVTPSIIIHLKPKSMDNEKGLLHHPSSSRMQRKEKEDNDVMRYQALKRKPQTEAHAKKNMMIYLRNMVGFKMDYFKGMSYDDIRPIFEKFNSNVAFLEKTREQIEKEDSKALKRTNDVYTEATPLVRKVLVVDYKIYTENNKPYYKIIRADGSPQLFLGFLSLLRNFDREDLELTSLTYMFEKPDVQDQVWKNQRTVHGLAKVKSWRLLKSCGVHIIIFTSTQMILLVERRYLLTRFTLDQMLNNVSLKVEEESEVSLELLIFVSQQQQEGFRPE
nr:ribonuclease H-like domain-containing protein [Tanacetum cinerariifolium]